MNIKAPEDYMENTNTKVWWTCNAGHSFQSKIVHRARGNGCPYCNHRKVLSGFNDLETKFPEIAKEMGL